MRHISRKRLPLQGKVRACERMSRRGEAHPHPPQRKTVNEKKEKRNKSEVDKTHHQLDDMEPGGSLRCSHCAAPRACISAVCGVAGGFGHRPEAGHEGRSGARGPWFPEPTDRRRRSDIRPAWQADDSSIETGREREPAGTAEGENRHFIGSALWFAGTILSGVGTGQAQFSVRSRLAGFEGHDKPHAARPARQLAHCAPRSSELSPARPAACKGTADPRTYRPDEHQRPRDAQRADRLDARRDTEEAVGQGCGFGNGLATPGLQAGGRPPAGPPLGAGPENAGHAPALRLHRSHLQLSGGQALHALGEIQRHDRPLGHHALRRESRGATTQFVHETDVDEMGLFGHSDHPARGFARGEIARGRLPSAGRRLAHE